MTIGHRLPVTDDVPSHGERWATADVPGVAEGYREGGGPGRPLEPTLSPRCGGFLLLAPF